MRRIEKPATELLDPEFHVAVKDCNLAPSFDTWAADCYDALLTYFRAVSLDEKKNAASRIGRTAMEAAEAEVTVGVFINAICKNWREGIKDGRKAFDWRECDWDETMENIYVSKAMRHFVESDDALTLDEKISHLSALFCNANILWRRCDDLYL